MKVKILYVALFITAVACNNSPKEKSENNIVDKSKININISEQKIPNSIVYNPEFALWEYYYDTINEVFIPRKLKEFKNDTLSPEIIENLINNTWAKVQIKYVKTINLNNS